MNNNDQLLIEALTNEVQCLRAMLDRQEEANRKLLSIIQRIYGNNK